MDFIARTRFLMVLVVVLFLLSTGCRSESEQARALLNQAHELIRNEKPVEAKKVLAVVVAKYSHTPEATEANKLLTGFKVAEEVGEAKANETYKVAILTALATFRLDCGRYPTQEEGLKALISDPGINGWDGPYLPSSSEAVSRFEYTQQGALEPEIHIRNQKP